MTGVCGLSAPAIADSQNSSNYVSPSCINIDVSQVCGAPVFSPKAPHISFSDDVPKPQLVALTGDRLDLFEKSIEISLPLLIDDIYLGDISVRILDDNYWLPWNRLSDLISESLTTEVMGELENTVVNGYLEGRSINFELISIQYNPELLQIEISPKAGARETEVINFTARLNRQNVDYLDPGKFSIFVNPTIRTLYNWSGNNPNQTNLSPFGALDIGGRIGGERGVAFLSDFRFDTNDNFNIQRNETLFVYDSKSKLLRFTLGDIQTRSDSLQATSSIIGLSIERLFDLEPERQFFPKFQSSFRLDRPSNVQILQNGALRRELDLSPGQYDLRDLALSQGTNNLDLVITDEFGEERIISSRSYFDFNLLERGLWDFSMNAGLRSTFSQTGLNYTDEFVASGFLRRGVSKTLTVGADLQGDKSGANGGVSALWASPIGVFQGRAATSQYDFFGNGYSAGLAITNRGNFGLSNDITWALNFSSEYNSRRFRTLPTSAIDIGIASIDSLNEFQTPKLDISSGLQLTRDRWSFTTSLNYLKSYNGPRDTYGFSAGINYRLSNNLNLALTTNHSRNLIREDIGGRIRLTWRFNRESSINAGYDSIRNEAEFDYRKASHNNVGALSYNFRGVNNLSLNTHSLRGEAYYIGNRLEALAQHNISKDIARNNSDQITTASFRSSLAFVDGVFAIGRPVQETFAIVERHPNLARKKLLIDPEGENFRASTDGFGHALVGQLNAYGTTSFNYDVEDLPPGYDLGNGNFHVRAPLNAGYKVRVGSDATYALLGYVKNKETGEALAYLGGRLESLDDPDAEPVIAFTNRNGRLAALGLAPGRYRLTLNTDPIFTYPIEITDSDSTLVNIGELRVNIQDSES